MTYVGGLMPAETIIAALMLPSTFVSYSEDAPLVLVEAVGCVRFPFGIGVVGIRIEK